jgi:hypothetical protein
MIADSKARQLQALLGALPAPVAARLAKAIEIDRLNEGRALPHELILDGLRPVLRRVGDTSRTPTPLRLFCRPFEDLLSLQPRKEKQKGRIARSTIPLLWNWLAQTLAPDDVTSFAIKVKSAVLGMSSETALDQAEMFWTLAAQAVLTALDSERGRKSARAILQDEAGVEDAREIALLLSIGKEILVLQETLPRPLPSLTDEYVWKLRDIYDRVVQSVPDAAPYIAVVAMHRLERPWEALKLPLMISRQTQDTLISSTDMGMVGEILFGDIESYATAIRSAKPQMFDADDLITNLAGFTALSTGMVKAIEMRRDGKWGQRLMKDRMAVAEVMESFMERAAKEILAALPTLKAGSYAGGPRVPDLSHGVDPEKSSRALSYARLITGCRAFAAPASFGASNKDAIDEVCVAVKSYNEDLLKELRAAEGDKRIHAEQFFSLAVEIVSQLFSGDEAEILRRRGRAATGTAVAA